MWLEKHLAGSLGVDPPAGRLLEPWQELLLALGDKILTVSPIVRASSM